MKTPENLKGDRFGILTVLGYVGRKTGKELGLRGSAISTWWTVKCDCGAEFPVRSVQLKDKRVASCNACATPKPTRRRNLTKKAGGKWDRDGATNLSPMDPLYFPDDPILNDWIDTDG